MGQPGRPRKEWVECKCSHCKLAFETPAAHPRFFCCLSCMVEWRKENKSRRRHLVRSTVWHMGSQVPSPSALGFNREEYEAPRYKLAYEDGRTRPKLPFDYFDQDEREEA